MKRSKQNMKFILENLPKETVQELIVTINKDASDKIADTEQSHVKDIND